MSFLVLMSQTLPVFAAHIDKFKVQQELQASTSSWLHLFSQGKAFTTKVGTRSYARAVAGSRNI